MSAGDVLDRDPVTSLSVVVAGLVQGPVGPAVTITSQVPGTSMDATYDVGTGVLLGQTISVASSGTTVLLGLRQLP